MQKFCRSIKGTEARVEGGVALRSCKAQRMGGTGTSWGGEKHRRDGREGDASARSTCSALRRRRGQEGRSGLPWRAGTAGGARLRKVGLLDLAPRLSGGAVRARGEGARGSVAFLVRRRSRRPGARRRGAVSPPVQTRSGRSPTPESNRNLRLRKRVLPLK